MMTPISARIRSATSGAIEAELEPGMESEGIEVTGGAVVVVDDSPAAGSLVVVVVSSAPLLSHAVATRARTATIATTTTVRGFSIAGRLVVDPMNQRETLSSGAAERCDTPRRWSEGPERLGW
jgi:hypothetical protein